MDQDLRRRIRVQLVRLGDQDGSEQLAAVVHDDLSLVLFQLMDASSHLAAADQQHQQTGRQSRFPHWFAPEPHWRWLAR